MKHMQDAQHDGWVAGFDGIKTMSWNYRIVKYASGKGFGLHRVRYNAEGEEMSMSELPVTFAGDTPAEVVDELVLAKMDSTRRPVFVEPAGWGATETIEAHSEV